MVAINNDLADIPSVNFSQQGSDLAAPGASRAQLYVKSNGVWYILNGGTATRLADNPMTTPGDIIVAGASGLPSRLAKGADSTVLTIDPATHLPVWAAGTGEPTLTDWTPVFKQGGNTPSLTITYAKTYTWGGLIFAVCNVTFTGAGNGSNSITIEGFPTTATLADGAMLGQFYFVDTATKLYNGVLEFRAGTPDYAYFVCDQSGGTLGASPAYTIANTDKCQLILCYLP